MSEMGEGFDPGVHEAQPTVRRKGPEIRNVATRLALVAIAAVPGAACSSSGERTPDRTQPTSIEAPPPAQFFRWNLL